MAIVVVDIEVFKYDWIVVFLDVNSGEWAVHHNDNASVRDYLSQPGRVFCGYNNKHYDNHILKAIACGADNELIKQINDFIIMDERSGWEHWFLRKNRFWFDSFDLMDDTQVGTSLKHIEAHLGWNIEETEVDFYIDRPLTTEELESTIHYCKWDVKATAKLLTLRKGYLQAKLNVGRRKGIPDTKALYMTNAGLTAAFLDAKPQVRYDEREYQYPDNLERDFIPSEVFKFFDQLHDPRIPTKELFSSKLSLMIDGAEAKIGFGGIHHAQLKYYEAETETRVIRNFDVASLYPSLMVNMGYTSRNIPSAAIFEEVYLTRLKAKKTGDKQTANLLKLILNTTYGASLATTNPLYDPLMGRSICITGQLFILELAMSYLRDCKTVRILQLNTDGIMISVDKSELTMIDLLNDVWMTSKGLILEEDCIRAVWQKDVNNYIAVYTNGKIKTKGSYLTHGIAPAGAFSINNNFVIVKEAVIAYLVHGVPVEETIYACRDIHKYQIIAKAGGGYSSVYLVSSQYDDYRTEYERENRTRGVNKQGKSVWVKPAWRWDCYSGYRRKLQHVNRVYASVYLNQGILVKVKPDGTVGRIQGLPESCVIDNKNQLTLDQVDRQWYINQAKSYIKDYIG